VLQQSKPITTEGWDILSTSPYAVDEDGVFYTQTSNHVGGTLNHYSFLSALPVMCAGNIGLQMESSDTSIMVAGTTGRRRKTG